MTKMLKKVQKQREEELHEWKAENLITPKDCQQYGQSRHVQGLLKIFSNLHESNVQKQSAVQCRNYLMLMLTISNACRASNLMNITLYDLTQALADEEYFGAKVMDLFFLYDLVYYMDT